MLGSEQIRESATARIKPDGWRIGLAVRRNPTLIDNGRLAVAFTHRVAHDFDKEPEPFFLARRSTDSHWLVGGETRDLRWAARRARRCGHLPSPGFSEIGKTVVEKPLETEELVLRGC